MIEDYKMEIYKRHYIHFWKDRNQMNIEIVFKKSKVGGAVLGAVTKREALIYAKRRIDTMEFNSR